jgi:cytochrome b561
MISSLGASAARYSGVAQFLHWLTAVVVAVAFIVSVGGPESRVYSTAKDFDRNLHELLGAGVLVLTLVRLVWRVVDPRPVLKDIPQWMESVSNLVQWTLYGLLLLVPLTAMSGAWLEGHPISLLGIGIFPPMVAQSHEVGYILVAIHGWIGDAILWLAGLHAAGGLYHHFVMRDNVLRSMLPGFGRS